MRFTTLLFVVGTTAASRLLYNNLNNKFSNKSAPSFDELEDLMCNAALFKSNLDDKLIDSKPLLSDDQNT